MAVSSHNIERDNSSSLGFQLICVVFIILWGMMIQHDPPHGTSSDDLHFLEGWKTLGTHSGVSLYSKSNINSPMLAVRGVAVVGTEMPLLMETFFDIGLSKKWVADLWSFEEVKVDKAHNGGE